MEEVKEIETLLSSPNAADEDYRVKDLLDYDDKVEALKVKVDSTPDQSLVGIVGEYGIGKSVMLNKFREAYVADKPDAIWIHFDAWKYPDRSNLWEGFVIDFVEQYDQTLFDTVRKLIDGEPIDKKTTAIVEGSLDMLPGIGRGAAKIFAKLTATSPVKRVFQIQELFVELLQNELKRGRRIYIEIEDADRSGQPGINFIETLSHFLKNFPLNVQIKALMPIAKSSFEDESNQRAYIKALDIVVEFEVDSRDMNKFVEAIFNSAIVKDRQLRHYFVEWCQRLLNIHRLTPRQIKFIIRGAEAAFQNMRRKGQYPDPLIVLLIESAKLFHESNGQTSFNKFRQNNAINSRSQIALFIKAQRNSVDVQSMAAMMTEDRGSIFSNEIRFSTHEKATDRVKFNPNFPMRAVRATEVNGFYWLPANYLEA